MAQVSLEEIDADLLRHLTDEELAELDELIKGDPYIWTPLAGPQSDAYFSKADIIGYGGAAGGGKTDLACGKALTQHQVVAVFRKTGTELTAIIDRFTQLLDGRDGYNGQEKIWRRIQRQDGKHIQIEFGSFPNIGDETKYQGRPHDLIVYDEAANMNEKQVRFTMGWLRTVDPEQPCQVLMTFNPPTTAEGRWIIDYFGPWLDKKHKDPALPGELRWFATVNGEDVEVDNGEQFEHEGELITPLSRTFIPSRISDNPYLMGTNYMSTLQSLPEPLRSQMLNGDFSAGMRDSEWQVIPTAWVEAAQARWKELDVKPPMDSVGIDVSRGGDDKTVLYRRHGNWYDRAIEYEGSQAKDGPTVAGFVLTACRDQAVQHIDVIGVGSSPYDFLRQAGQQIVGVNVAEKSNETDMSGRLRFQNERSARIWKFRELLDPSSNHGVALPPDKPLLRELCAYTWKLRGDVISVCGREDLIEVLGNSPDYASALFLASMDTPKIAFMKSLNKNHLTTKVKGHDPYNF